MAGDLIRVLSAEKYKALKLKRTFILPVGIVLLSFLVSMSIDFATQRDWIGLASGFYLSAVTMRWLINIITILTVIMTCFLISGEFAMRTVKPAWTRPLKRESWFTGKLIAAFTAVMILLIIAAAAVLTYAAARHGFADLKEKEYLVHSAGSMASKFLVVFLLTGWVMAGVISFAGMIASWLNRPGSAISVTIVIAFLMTALSVFPAVSPFLLTTYLSLPFEQMVAMSKGLPLPLEWGTLAWRTLACCGLWMAASFAAGITSIRKKEITF